MASSNKLKVFSTKHNHEACIDRALGEAESMCSKNGLRFTDIRRRVLELVWSSHQPVTAYDLLKTLRQEKDNAEPPTVYRALDFLLDLGLVHRLASLNAFIGCSHPGHDHPSCFLLCQQCGKAQEMEAGPWCNALDEAAQAQGFAVEQQLTEILGTCPQCREASDEAK